MRRSIPMLEHWCFQMPGKESETIQLPHTWNNRDGQDGGNDYLRLGCEYSHSFETPAFDPETELVYLECDGVNASCEVLLNGHMVGQHDGGYSTFRFDITDFLSGKNDLLLRVDNSVNDHVYPQKADFTFYGGIYREVRLLIVPRAHFKLDYFGGNGLKLTPRPVREYRDGEVEVESWYVLPEGERRRGGYETEGQNIETPAASDVAKKSLGGIQTVEVQLEILNSEGAVVAEERFSGRDGHMAGTLLIPGVHLWNGLRDPYLYTLRASLYVDGTLADETERRFGVRDFRVDPEQGFYLNGHPYPLHGVSRHQDRRDLGNAITEKEHREDLELILETGANTVRLAHYQHSQIFYDLCDEKGLVVWAEIPYISEHLPKGRENTISQMRELIVQNHHHASICFWGISNEITISTKDHRDMMENHRLLNDLCHRMDPSRLTTLACYAACLPWDTVVHQVSDLVGYNYYLGWYTPFPWLNDLIMKCFHFFYPKRRMCYSEYGAEAMPNLHSGKPKRGDQTEEYQLQYLEYMLRFFDRNPWLWGNYLWNMFDFAADARNQGGEPGMNHKGLITFDRCTKKDSFYLYKAWWSEAPFVHITGKRRADREESVTEIKVYSNQPEVTLFANGEKLETKRGEKVFTFMVPMTATLTVEAQSGELRDAATFRRVSAPNPAYRLAKTQSKSANWT